MDLVLPASLVQTLGLPRLGSTTTGLADGSQVTLPSHICLVSWLGLYRKVIAAASQRQLALIGSGLLKDYRLTIDYSARTVRID